MFLLGSEGHCSKSHGQGVLADNSTWPWLCCLICRRTVMSRPWSRRVLANSRQLMQLLCFENTIALRLRYVMLWFCKFNLITYQSTNKTSLRPGQYQLSDVREFLELGRISSFLVLSRHEQIWGNASTDPGLTSRPLCPCREWNQNAVGSTDARQD